MTAQSHARRARNRRLLAAPLLACLIAAGSSWPAIADTGPANPASIPPPANPGPVQAAQLQAASTGQPVSVPSLTTETTSVVANPDGSLTQTTNVLPVRVQQNGVWTSLDDTLALNADGTVSPKATPTTVVLSGGGSGPLVSLTDPAGHALALSMPFTLPTPTLSGNTALYSSVLPGVDLSVSVDQQGTFREVLIVHDATAAADPALKTLQLAASAPGLTLATDSGGGMVAKAADGSAVFSSPTPIMWDSSTGTSGSASKLTAMSASTSTNADPSSDTGPGTGAQVDPVGLTTTGSTNLTLTPDQSLLTGTNTTYPVYIDPEVTNGTKYYTQVWQGCPDADTGWNTEEGNGTTAGEGIGYIQPAWGGCGGGGAEESFYVMDLSGIPHGSVVSVAQLNLTQTYGSDSGCTKTWPVTLKVTDDIYSPTSSNPTTWNHRPAAATGVMAFSQTNQMYSVSGSCPGASNTTSFNLASQVNAAQGGTITFGLYGDESTSSSNFGHMRFARNPYIQTTYDLKPSIDPSTVNTFPRAINVASDGTLVDVSPACGSGTPGWIGLTSTNYGASSIWMQSTATTPISGTSLAIWYSMVDNMVNDGHGNPKQVTYGNISYASAPRDGKFQMTSTVQDGHQYSWNTQASDGTLTSNTVADCRFNVDVTPPTQATVSSSDFPPSGSGITPPKNAGQAGSFTLTATDPAPDPSTCTLHACLPASGIAGFRYSLDQPIPTVGFKYWAASNGQLPITPGMWGSHILYVEAVDNAGNVQTVPSTYSFYAPWNPAAKVTAGDLTGDNIPDMLATDANGDLILLSGGTDPSTVTATVAGDRYTSPDGSATSPDDWSNFYIAHRGSLQHLGVDDLFAYNPHTSVMYRYTNDGSNGGTYGHFSVTSGRSTITHPTCTATGRCTNYNSDWSGVKGMIAPGDLAGDTTGTVANLITKELDGSGKQELWIYQTTDSAPLSNPMLLGTGDWSHFDLITPGVVGGNLSTNTAGTPMLWARDKTSGIVYSFPLKDTNGNITEFPAPTAAPLTLGVNTTTGGHLCLADGNDSAQSGAPAIIWNCDNGPEQSMTFLTDQTVRFHSGLCLNATGTTNDAPVTLTTCDGTSAQHWTAGNAGSLKNSASGLCLADPSAYQSPGTSLIMYTCDNGSEQNWAALTNGLLPTPLASAPTMLQPVLTTVAYPTVASPGDYTGLGQPNLYGTTPNNEIIDFPGTAPNGTTATFGTPQSQGSYNTASGWWNLADGSGTTAADSSAGGHNATLTGGATWSPPGLADSNKVTRVTSSNPNGTVLHTDGAGYANTGSTVIDTTKSFTVSAWVDLNSVTTTEIALGEGTTNHQAFYLGLNPAVGGWLFQGTSDDTSNTTYYTAASSTPAAAGVWTHLVGVYDANAHTMALYVNGHLTATTSGATLVAATGPLTIGAILTTGSTTPYAQTAGYVSDVHAYQIAMSTAAASTLNDNPPSISQLN